MGACAIDQVGASVVPDLSAWVYSVIRSGSRDSRPSSVDVSEIWCHPADMRLMPASIISNVIGSGVRLFSLTV